MSQPVALPGSASRGLGVLGKDSGCYPVGSTDGLLCLQLFGDVCYNCSHVIEGDGKASVPPNSSLPCFFPGGVVRGERGWELGEWWGSG